MHLLKVRNNAYRMAKFVNGRKLIAINVLSGRYIKGLPKGFDEFCEELPKKTLGFGQHSNYIFFLLEEYMIWSTLGLTGCWEEYLTENSRIEFKFDNGKSIYYSDSRNFGTLSIYKGKFLIQKKLKEQELDIFNTKISIDYLKDKIKKYSDASVAYLFLKVLSGLEKSWVEEIFYRCDIDPTSKCSNLKDFEINVLVEFINDMISSIKDSQDPFGIIDLSFENEYIGNLSQSEEGQPVETITTDDNIKIKMVKR